jgi:hypothetical protein
VYYFAAVVEAERDGSVAGLVHLDTNFKNGRWELRLNGRRIDEGNKDRHDSEQTLVRPYALVEFPSEAGRTYFFQVIAEDGSGNKSEVSEAAQMRSR